MLSDTDLIREIRDYIQGNGLIGIDEIVNHFTAKGINRDKLEYILREIIQ